MWPALAAVALVVLAAGAVALLARPSRPAGGGLATNPDLDPGTRLSGAAPDFTLTDQFGRRVSLRSFLGKVVILAFTDSQCTTICPLTTTAMLDAKRLLGPAGAQVQLLGVDANPAATSIRDVRAYSELHGMMRQWRFLTGSPAQLESVWKAYKVGVAIAQGQIDHTPALFVIDPKGRLAKLYLTQQAYAAVGQLGQLLAREASRLLPTHPPVRSHLSYGQIPGIPPDVPLRVPRAGGGEVELGARGGPRLYLFFATWDREVTDLGRRLDALNGYAQQAPRSGLPSLTAVDEAAVEPSPAALPAFLAELRRPLTYPVAIDRSGRIADGYGVQDQPWLVLASAAGSILWYRDLATSGWLTPAELARQLRSALAAAPGGPASAAAIERELAGSPAPLAALHRQADQLLGGEPALAERIRALRGYPIVINAWGSWCEPCRAEFGLLAVAAARYGRQVAFLGADVNDDPGDARAFLAQHPVSYPSYQMSSAELAGIVPSGIVGTPTTIFLSRAGGLAYVHTGQYESQGALDGDIETYALGG
jgi:cytochrome oxidase Cu insertion factor (SCO1/SenC/PrrC family)/thiol-disulfide isomerase/thioredoxin